VTYSTDVNIADNPLNEPAKITIKGQRREVVWFYDAKGRPKLNTAGDLIGDPAPTRIVTDLIFNVEKNMALKLEAWILDYLDTVNSDAVRLRGLTCKPGTLLFAGEIDVGDEQNTSGQQGGGQKLVPFTVVKFQLLYRADGWTTIVPNRGFNQVVPLKNQTVPPAASGDFQAPKPSKQPKFKYTIERILVGDPKDYPTEPQFLDSNGMLIENPTPDNILLLEFDDFEERAFNQLPLK
jgi:hypothetical protein